VCFFFCVLFMFLFSPISLFFNCFLFPPPQLRATGTTTISYTISLTLSPSPLPRSIFQLSCPVVALRLHLFFYFARGMPWDTASVSCIASYPFCIASSPVIRAGDITRFHSTVSLTCPRLFPVRTSMFFYPRYPRFHPTLVRASLPCSFAIAPARF